MVSRWGMSERIGPVMFAQSQEHVFLGKEIAQSREYSEAMAAMVDAEIQRLLTELEARGRELLESHRSELDTLAAALEKEETLEAEAIRELLGHASAQS